MPDFYRQICLHDAADDANASHGLLGDGMHSDARLRLQVRVEIATIHQDLQCIN